MSKLDKYDIEQIAESAFERILEDPEDYMSVAYPDMTSADQEKYITSIKKILDDLFDTELEEIEKNWSNESAEIKRLKNENARLKEQIRSMDTSFREDMGR